MPEINTTAAKVREVIEKQGDLKSEAAISRFIEAFNSINWTEGSLSKDIKGDLYVAFLPDAFITNEYKIFVKNISMSDMFKIENDHFNKKGFQFELERLDGDEFSLHIYLDRKVKR